MRDTLNQRKRRMVNDNRRKGNGVLVPRLSFNGTLTPSYDFEYTLMEETRESEQTLPTFTYNTATTYANEQQRHEDDGDDSGIYIIIVNIETAANLAQQTKFGHLYKQPKQPRKIGKNNISFK